MVTLGTAEGPTPGHGTHRPSSHHFDVPQKVPSRAG